MRGLNDLARVSPSMLVHRDVREGPVEQNVGRKGGGRLLANCGVVFHNTAYIYIYIYGW